MKLLRYLIVDSLTFGGKILPNVNDLAKVEKILLWLEIQFTVFFCSAIILFYFISFSWIMGFITGALFTFIYISITLILLSGFRRLSYLKRENKVLTNSQIIIGKTKIDVSEVTYDSVPKKSQLITSIILRITYIIGFSFTIFCGLTLGLSMLFYPNLEEIHGQEIIHNYEKAYPSLYGDQIDDLRNQLNLLRSDRLQIEKNKIELLTKIEKAPDEFHKSFLQVDLTIIEKQIMDWDLLHNHELNNIPNRINELDAEYKVGLGKLQLSVQYSKYGIYRIQHFLKNLIFLSLIMIGLLVFTFIYPFYLRYQMVLTESDLDIKLENKTIDFIKEEFIKSNQEIKKIIDSYGYSLGQINSNDPFLPIAKLKSEKVALKNQLDTFLTNELA
ncbi:hypothetical protein V7S76_12920 [Aquirufa sp. ROCK2-A2]